MPRTVAPETPITAAVIQAARAAATARLDENPASVRDEVQPMAEPYLARLDQAATYGEFTAIRTEIMEELGPKNGSYEEGMAYSVITHYARAFEAALGITHLSKEDETRPWHEQARAAAEAHITKGGQCEAFDPLARAMGFADTTALLDDLAATPTARELSQKCTSLNRRAWGKDGSAGLPAPDAIKLGNLIGAYSFEAIGTPFSLAV